MTISDSERFRKLQMMTEEEYLREMEAVFKEWQPGNNNDASGWIALNEVRKKWLAANLAKQAPENSD